MDVEYIKVAGKEIMEEATRKVERCIAVETVLRVLNAHVVYRVENDRILSTLEVMSGTSIITREPFRTN